MKVIAFAASNSKKSINKKLVTFASSLIVDAEITVLDLNDFDLPIFSVDREEELGQPERAQAFLNEIEKADVILISFAEHNGTYAAVYKNLFDWVSRIKKKVYQDKQVILMATSPGAGGAKNVLASAVSAFPHFGAEVVGSLSVPSFQDNFDLDSMALTNPDLVNELKSLIAGVNR